MNWKSFSFVSAAIVFLVVATGADGALNAYMSVKGQKQGLIQGGVTQKGREGKIGVIAMTHEIVSPRDSATGQATGKRQHKPLTVTMEWDRSLPALYNALFNNEVLTDVQIDFWTASPTGAEVNYMTYRLTNASIASITSRMPNNKMPDLLRLREQVDVSFTYQKFDVAHKQGGGAASDSWIGIARADRTSEVPSPLLAIAGL